MTSRAARVAVLPSALSLVLLAAPAAHAQSLTVQDAAGDAANGKLDITSATVRNGDYRLVATVALAEMEKGSVIVSVDRRRGKGIRLVSVRRADGTVHSRVLKGAFTDTDVDGGAVTCKKFRSVWDDDAGTVTLRMPSACWHGGDYGAVRFAVLTEKHGADHDAAPTADDGSITASAWVPRG
jgi:uncharacterized DUF497 family protein